MAKIIAIQNFTTAERRKSSRRSARSLNNERRNYAVKNGDRVETQHLRLHLHLSRSAAGGRWRKGPRRALRGRRRTLARKRDIRASRRVHDKSLKRRSPEWRAPPLINAPPNTVLLSLSLFFSLSVNYGDHERAGVILAPRRSLCFASACDRALYSGDRGWFTPRFVKHALAIIYPNAYYNDSDSVYNV